MNAKQAKQKLLKVLRDALWHEVESKRLRRIANNGVRGYRESVLGESLRSTAKRIGVSAAFLSDVELGRRNASKKLIAAL